MYPTIFYAEIAHIVKPHEDLSCRSSKKSNAKKISFLKI